MGLQAGFSLKDIDFLDVFYLLDLLVEKANISNRAEKVMKEPKVRKATQADFDAM